MTGILIVLSLLMIIGAVVAIETRVLLHAVISVGAVGFLLSIVFLFLSAPDLAITQIAVEVVTLAVLLRVVARGRTPPVAERRGWAWVLVASLAVVLVLVLLGVPMLAELPEFGRPVMDRFADAPSSTYLEEGLESTGAANIVTAVLLDYRAYDTLGVASVLFCAVIGALTVLGLRAGRRAREEEP